MDREQTRRSLEALLVAYGEFLDWRFSGRSGEDELFIPYTKATAMLL